MTDKPKPEAELLADELDYKGQRGIDPYPSELRDAAAELRRLSAVEAERDALARWKSTNAPRIRALEGLLEHSQIEAAAGREALQTLTSERAANEVLTNELAAAQAQVARLEADAQKWLQTLVSVANEAAAMQREYGIGVVTVSEKDGGWWIQWQLKPGKEGGE